MIELVILDNENLIPSFPYDVIIEKIYKLNQL